MKKNTCSTCNIGFTKENSHPSILIKGNGRCKNCHREYSRKHPGKRSPEYIAKCTEARRGALAEYHRKNKSRLSQRKKIHNLLYNYKMTLEEYEAKVKEQDNKCALCSEEMKKVCIDHDHNTGQTRELLCNRCNMGLGHFFDDIDLLSRAVEYLKKHKSLAQLESVTSPGGMQQATPVSLSL